MYQYTDFDRRFVQERAAQYRDQLTRRLNGQLSEEEFRQLAMAMGSSNVIGSYTELADIAKRSGIDQEEIARTIKEAQDAQAKGPGGVAAQTDMRRAQMETRDSLQNLL